MKKAATICVNVALNAVAFGFISCHYQGGNATLGFWNILIPLAVAGIGLVSSSNTNKKNEKLATDAREAEEERRARAAEEYAKTIDAYNQLREERPGLTLKDYIAERVQALNNPELEKAFRETREEDFNQAQGLANKASRSNLSVFNDLMDEVTQGANEALVGRRNEIALTDDAQARFARALELSAPAVAAGSAPVTEEGVEPGSRAHAQAFRIAEEVDRASRNEQFDKINTILTDDRALALNLQERAKNFLDFTSFADFASNVQRESFATRAAFQMSDEERQFQLARDFALSATGNQTQQPAYYPNVGNQIFAEGVSAAMREFGNSYNTNRKNQV